MKTSRMTKLKVALVAIMIAATGGVIAACSHPSDTVSNNISKDADSFKVFRRIVVINMITDKYLMTVEGYCALGNDDPTGQITVICKTGPNTYTKDFAFLGDNASALVEQLEPIASDPYHHKILFRPELLVPDIDHP